MNGQSWCKTIKQQIIEDGMSNSEYQSYMKILQVLNVPLILSFYFLRENCKYSGGFNLPHALLFQSNTSKLHLALIYTTILTG
jgi:hypothetical protein